jgi:putative transcriptional regulator
MHNPTEYSGKMLIALPRVKSRIFQQTVVYVHTDNDEGALGFIVNLPMDPDQAEIWSTEINWQWPERIYHGGPVESHMGYILHSPEYAQPNTVQLNSSISYTSGTGIINDINRGIGPSKFTLLVGYCQWHPGQIADEVMRGDWHVAEFDADHFFQDLHREHGWKFAIGIEADNLSKKLLDTVDNS